MITAYRLLLPLLVPLLSIAPAPAQGIRLARVPDRVELPAPDGQNLVLEVETTGTPEQVWLASEVAARDTVPLQRVAAQRYQVNLADPRVQSLLPAGRDGGELLVFARQQGHVEQSAPIRWARARNKSPVHGLLRFADGSTATVEPDQHRWLDTAELNALELHGANTRQDTAVARLGRLELPLVRHKETGLWTFEQAPLLRGQAPFGGHLEVEMRQGTASHVLRFDLVPLRLDLQADPVPFRLQQRTAIAIPGTGGWLRVRIDDITMGQVQLAITTADEREVVPPRSVIEDEAVDFSLHDGHYVLVVDDLVNNLINDDHAVLTVHDARTFARDRITLLVRAVGRSLDMFVRGDRVYTGAQAELFLISKIGTQRDLTVDRFIDEVASKSSTTGEVYRVRRGDDSEVTMAEWLRDELQRIAPSTSR